MVRRICFVVAVLASVVLVAPARAQTPSTYQPSGPICRLLSTVTTQGGPLTAICDNWAGNTQLSYSAISEPTFLGTGITNAAGSLTKTLTIPVTFALGPHTLLVTGNARDGQPRTLALAFTVVGPATAGTGLGRTGSNVAPWAITGVSLLVLGSAMVLLVRRRRTPADA